VRKPRVSHSSQKHLIAALSLANALQHPQFFKCCLGKNINNSCIRSTRICIHRPPRVHQVSAVALLPKSPCTRRPTAGRQSGTAARRWRASRGVKAPRHFLTHQTSRSIEPNSTLVFLSRSHTSDVPAEPEQPKKKKKNKRREKKKKKKRKEEQKKKNKKKKTQKRKPKNNKKKAKKKEKEKKKKKKKRKREEKRPDCRCSLRVTRRLSV